MQKIFIKYSILYNSLINNYNIKPLKGAATMDAATMGGGDTPSKGITKIKLPS